MHKKAPGLRKESLVLHCPSLDCFPFPQDLTDVVDYLLGWPLMHTNPPTFGWSLTFVDFLPFESIPSLLFLASESPSSEPHYLLSILFQWRQSAHPAVSAFRLCSSLCCCWVMSLLCSKTFNSSHHLQMESNFIQGPFNLTPPCLVSSHSLLPWSFSHTG